MPSISAKLKQNKRNPRLVVFVVYPDIVLLDLVGPLQVFSHALDQQTETNGYTCAVASLAGGMIDTNTVVSIPSESIADFSRRKIHTLIIVGGDGANTAMHNRTLLNKIFTLARRAERVASVCSGALVLAAAGLLDGRRAVTHWEDCENLQNTFPKVRVEMDPIYIKDGKVWTSAGVTAGIDMALAMVSEDLGKQASLNMARSMVTQMMRSGGQSQFSPILSRQLMESSSRFETLNRWIADNLQRELSVEDLAARMHMSTRNFSRTYSREMGVSPAKAVESMRTELARTLLETTDLGVKQIARRCGFNDEERLRRSFVRLLNVSPSDYRQQFKTI